MLSGAWAHGAFLAAAIAVSFLPHVTLARESDPDESFGSGKLDLSIAVAKTTLSPFDGVLVTPKTVLVPGVYYERGNLFAGTKGDTGYDITGVGYYLAHSPRLQLGVALSYQPGRKEAKDVRYHGLGDVAGSAETVAFAQWNPFSGRYQELVQVYGNASRATNHARGVIGTFGVTVGVPVTETAHGFLDISANWNDSRYARSYYGVTTAQAAASAYPAYRPGSGIAVTTVSTGIDYNIGRKWEFVWSVGKMHFVGDVGRSPVIGKPSLPTLLLLLTRHY